MKRFLLILLFASGCSTASYQASNYCDENWSKRYDSWKECYDHQLPQYNKGFRAVGSLLNGAGSGLQNSRKNSTSCTTWGNQITCN